VPGGDNYDKELRQRASAYWSAIAQQRDAAHDLAAEGVRGVQPADVAIPLSARDYPDPSAAFRAARHAHTAGWRVVHRLQHPTYYHGVRVHPAYYHNVRAGYAAVQAAEKEWKHHQGTLSSLDARIKAQYAALEQMYGQETRLAYRHQLITEEMHRLLHEADRISDELQSVKGRYGAEVDDLRRAYRRDAREVRVQEATADKELKENREALKELREKVREASVKAAGLREEAQHSMEDVELQRRRTREHEEEEKVEKMSERHAHHHEIMFKHREADRLAGEKESEEKARSVKETARMSAAASVLVDKKVANAVKTRALADVQGELQRAAEEAREDSLAELSRTREEVRNITWRIRQLERDIYHAKGETADAKVVAAKYTDLSRTAKQRYDKVTELEHKLETQIDQAESSLSRARAKKVEEETEAKLANVTAEGDTVLAEHQAKEAEEAEGSVEGRVAADHAQEEALEWEGEGYVNKTVSLATGMYNASMYAFLYRGEARNKDEMSDAVLRHAEQKEQRADKLLKSVDALAALAKTAAEMARAHQIKDEARRVASGGGGEGAPAPKTGSFAPPPGATAAKEEPSPPVSSVHGLPIPGLGYLERDDKGTGKFLDAGINV